MLVLVLLVAAASPAWGRPTAPTVLCQTYPTIPDCLGRTESCSLCHTSTDPPAWNAFGQAVKSHIDLGVPFEQTLPNALHAVEQEDSDGDGTPNLSELEAGTLPGVAEASGSSADGNTANPNYRVDGYDPRFAFRRLSILYCGRSPTYAEMTAFNAAPADDQTLKERLHARLTSCLDSDYWKKKALPRLADKRIRPLFAAGADSDIMIGTFRLVIGDYWYDYRLWQHIMTGDRDMRELLTADYHVIENDKGELEVVHGIIPKADPGALAGGQPLPDNLRAGMITTQWYLAINTMFSPLPRTSAAQAYRSYLGADISNSEGLRPVPGEPVDVDHKGVGQPRCANCHSTLDPLSYAFAKYEGIQVSAELKFGWYRPERPAQMIPGWDDSKQVSVILGQQVPDLVTWGRVAAASDEFKRNLADIFFRQALGGPPKARDQSEFIALWQSIPGDGYSANRLIHRLVDTDSFGRP